MVAAFSNLDDWAVQAISQFKNAHGFPGEAYKAAKYAMDRTNGPCTGLSLWPTPKQRSIFGDMGVILAKIVD
jgi:hypothetical protein